MRQLLSPPEVFDTFIGGIDPRWKLAGIIVAVAVIVCLQTVMASAVALACALSLAAVARLPPRWLAGRLGGLCVFLVIFTIWMPFLLADHGPTWAIGPISVSARGVAVAARLWCKALAIVTLVLVQIGSAPLPRTWQALHALRVPGILVQLLSLAHRYVFLLTRDLGSLRVALRVRGYRHRAAMHSVRTMGHTAGILLVRGLEQAERVSQAMRCRGFDGRYRSLTTFATRWADIAVFTAIVGSAGIVWFWDLARR
jgi:cobalt/nickel transport system permease protein